MHPGENLRLQECEQEIVNESLSKVSLRRMIVFHIAVLVQCLMIKLV